MCGCEFLLDNKAVSRPDCNARHRASPAIQAIGLTRLPACAAVGSQERARSTACALRMRMAYNCRSAQRADLAPRGPIKRVELQKFDSVSYFSTCHGLPVQS